MGKITWTMASAMVIEAICRGYQFGHEIMEMTGLPSGTVYPMLRRLETNGFLRSRWESRSAANREARPQRRYYEPTNASREILPELRARFTAIERMIPAPGESV